VRLRVLIFAWCCDWVVGGVCDLDSGSGLFACDGGV
jgi:hypothetical protein